MTASTELFNLTRRTALITGATGHLGSSMALALAQAGAHVLVNSRSRARCEALVKTLNALGHSAEAVPFDVGSSTEISSFFAQLADRPLHILINNAYAGGAGSIEVAQADAYADSYHMSVVSAHNLVVAALPALKRAKAADGDASVINLASMYALVSPDQRIYASAHAVNPPFYGAAKAALLQWTRYAACEFGPQGIRVNAISPGPFPSGAVQSSNPAFVDTLASKVPLGRIGQSPEMQGPALFLASPASSFVNGANLVVDGGWTCW